MKWVIFLLATLISRLYSQPLTVDWIKTIDYKTCCAASDIMCDNNGDIVLLTYISDVPGWFSKSGHYLIKIDKKGSILWTDTIFRSNQPGGYSLKIDNADTIYFLVTTWIVKYSPNGKLSNVYSTAFETSFGMGIPNDLCELKCDENYFYLTERIGISQYDKSGNRLKVIHNSTYPKFHYFDYQNYSYILRFMGDNWSSTFKLLEKRSIDDELVWEHDLSLMPFNKYGTPFKMAGSTSGETYIYTNNEKESTILKVNANGSIAWQKSLDTIVSTAYVDGAGELILIGHTRDSTTHSAHIWKITTAGVTKWLYTYKDTSEKTKQLEVKNVAAFGKDIYFACTAYEAEFSCSTKLVKLIDANSTVSTPKIEPNKPMRVFQEPAKGQIHISEMKGPATISLFDLSGRLYNKLKFKVESDECVIQTEGLMPGIYCLTIETVNSTEFVKLVLE